MSARQVGPHSLKYRLIATPRSGSRRGAPRRRAYRRTTAWVHTVFGGERVMQTTEARILSDVPPRRSAGCSNPRTRRLRCSRGARCSANRTMPRLRCCGCSATSTRPSRRSSRRSTRTGRGPPARKTTRSTRGRCGRSICSASCGRTATTRASRRPPTTRSRGSCRTARGARRTCDRTAPSRA